MTPKFVAEEGSLKGLVLSLEDGDQWIIGRDPDTCQLLVEDPAASRKHLVCRTTPQGILIENLSTTNPTQVNDEEVKEPRLLQNGDAVKIGDGVFRFYAEAAAQLFKDAPQSEQEISTNGIEPEKEPNAYQEPQDEKKLPEDQPEMLGSESIKEEPSNEETAKEDDIYMKSAPQEESSPDFPPEHTSEGDDSHADEEERHDTIYEEEPSDKHALAEINFGLLETGRWLLKVVGGPNNGAEFSMQAGSSYVVGTDPNACDIVFHDTSVSRQHARIAVREDESLTIEDLKSRNGTTVDGEPLTGKRPLPTNTIVSMGTTAFVVFDREGEMQTIISPLLPSIVKVLQKEEPRKAGEPVKAAETPAPVNAAPLSPPPPPALSPVEQHHTAMGAFILIGIITGLFVIVGIGTSTLFKSEPVVVAQTVDPTTSLDNALAPFPSVKYTFNKNTGQLLLVGHVLTASDRNQLLYSLQGLNFIKSLDDSGIIIDEYVWREINQVLEKNPDWRGITILTSSPGHFIVSGYLQTKAQADRLSEYLNANFPYPDLLEKRIIVDEEVTGTVNSQLQNAGFTNITAKLDNAEIILNGAYPIGRGEELNALATKFKEIRGVRSVRNLTVEMAQEQSIVNISDKYEVTGLSRQGSNRSAVINGRILMIGDVLDGMAITNIQPHAILLEKDGTKYRIDFNR